MLTNNKKLSNWQRLNRMTVDLKRWRRRKLIGMPFYYHLPAQAKLSSITGIKEELPLFSVAVLFHLLLAITVLLAEDHGSTVF
jgi:hypothetical protein